MRERFSHTLNELEAELNRKPTETDVLAHLRKKVLECGAKIQIALILGPVPIQMYVATAGPDYIQSIMNGVSETADKKRVHSAVVAMNGLLDVLRKAAE